MITVKNGYRLGGSGKTSAGYTSEREYVVLVSEDEPIDALELRVQNADGIPLIGDVISEDFPNVKVDSVTPSEINENGFRQWKVKVTYKTLTDSDFSTDPTQDPTTLKPVVNAGSVRRAEVLERAYKTDENGNVTDKEGDPTDPVVNTMGDIFNPPVVIEYSNQVLSISRNLRTFDFDWITEFENTTNKSKVRIAGTSVEKNQAFMSQIRAVSALDNNGVTYYQVQYEIEISKRGFDKQLLNIGFKKQDPDTAEPTSKVDITYSDIQDNPGDKADTPVSDPQRLTESGQVIVDPKDPSFYVVKKVYFPKKWTSLNIPSSR
jgi:hypothetical protein